MLARQYRVIAPDLRGYGERESVDLKNYQVTADAITKRLSDMTDAELATLEARMITIPATLALEHVDEPLADGDTNVEQDGDGCADDECADEAAGNNT
jgi:pimeloyl-ACP methyl ester carboxylesterase